MSGDTALQETKDAVKTFQLLTETFVHLIKNLLSGHHLSFLSDNSAIKELFNGEINFLLALFKVKNRNSKENKAGANLYLLPGKPPLFPQDPLPLVLGSLLHSCPPPLLAVVLTGAFRENLVLLLM